MKKLKFGIAVFISLLMTAFLIDQFTGGGNFIGMFLSLIAGGGCWIVLEWCGDQFHENDHGIKKGDKIDISGTSKYNGSYVIKKILK